MQKEIAKINKIRTQLEVQSEFYKNFQPDTIPFIKKEIDSLNLLQQTFIKI